MKSAFVIALTVFLVAATEAKVAGSAESQSVQPLDLTNLIQQAQNSIASMISTIETQMNVTDTSLAEIFKEQSTKFGNAARSYITDVSQKLSEVQSNPTIQRVWTDVTGNITKAFEDLNAKIAPDAQAQLSELQTGLQKGLETVVEQSQKVVQAMKEGSEKAQEDLAKFTQQTVNLVVDTTSTLANEVKKHAATEHPAH